MSKAKLAIALSTLIAVMVPWAVPIAGTAHHLLRSNEAALSSFGTQVLDPVPFKESKGRGLLVSTWINGTGPYTFAIDTGAGVSLVSRDLVQRAGLPLQKSRQTLVGGLSSSVIASNESAQIREVALGSRNNALRTNFLAAVVPMLPARLDGILDPTEAFKPLGYSIDLPQGQLRLLDLNRDGLRASDTPRDGAVVKWIRHRGDHRPFVRLGDGRVALLDTGSGFGLAISDARQFGMNHRGEARVTRDLGGGEVQAKRVAPVTVNLGSLVLRNVPTDLLTGAPSDTPVILGRDALYPFRITFDPAANLIAIEPSESR
jgi:predicted aspartyl protease